jgi:hypothetical protein
VSEQSLHGDESHDSSAFSNFPCNYSSDLSGPIFPTNLSLNAVPYGDLSVSGLEDFQENHRTLDITGDYGLGVNLGDVSYQAGNGDDFNFENTSLSEGSSGQSR